MKHLISMISLLGLVSTFPACLLQKPDALDGFYVSGHLGTYFDCRDEGYTEREESAKRSSEPSGDIAEGACAPPEDELDSEYSCGGGPLNCQAAQVTLRLSNTSTVDIEGISIDTLDLIGDDDKVAATLPLIEVIDSDGLFFDGKLAAGEEVVLRIEFQGPSDLSEFLPNQNTYNGDAVIEVGISADDVEEINVRTKALSPLGVAVT